MVCSIIIVEYGQNIMRSVVGGGTLSQQAGKRMARQL